MTTGHGLGITVLLCWLVTEALGAIMLRSWIVSGGARQARQQPANQEGMSFRVLTGHAGLNLTGLLFWVLFLLSGVRALTWIALGFMALAIGLGISTVTIWTPYPGGRPKPDTPPPVVPDEVVKRALEDDALAQQLIDELLDQNLRQPSARTANFSLRPLIPLGHGVLAIATFLLATLAAIAAA